MPSALAALVTVWPSLASFFSLGFSSDQLYLGLAIFSPQKLLFPKCSTPAIQTLLRRRCAAAVVNARLIAAVASPATAMAARAALVCNGGSWLIGCHGLPPPIRHAEHIRGTASWFLWPRCTSAGSRTDGKALFRLL